MGVGPILRARRIILLANGAAKAEIIKRTVRGPITTEVPATLLQLHPTAELLLDEAAAALLG
jgi:glucosamine-6-phosphate deaminase